MEITKIPKVRVDELKEYFIRRIEIYPYDSSSGLASKAFYAGFTEFRFVDARAIAEKTKQVYLTHKV